MSINEIYLPGLIDEMIAQSDDYTKKFFRQKIIRVYIKCLRSGRTLLATKIAEKYRHQLTETLRSDQTVSTMYAIFASKVKNKQS